MINPTQHKNNTAYNHFLTKLVLWNGLYNRYKADKEQGYEPIKNYEKMLGYQAIVLSLLPSIELLERESIKSYFPYVDDIELIKLFKEAVC